MSSMQTQSDNERVVIKVEIVHNRVRITPEVVRVRKKGVVRWVFEVTDSARVAVARIYFEHGSPFSWIDFESQRLSPTTPFADVIAEPREAGEYKYGVRLASSDQEVLDDDDPWLIVE